MKGLSIGLLLIATLGIAVATNARLATGTLSGTVLDGQGKPVADAAVTMQTSYGQRPHATHTDASGRFEFVRFAPGQYDLRASANGLLSDWMKRVAIRPHKTTEVTLRLPASIN